VSKIWLPDSAKEEELTPWISFSQLEWVKNYIPDNGVFMEWGSGGSSVWFTENLPPTVERIIIESDHAWAERVRAAGTPVITPTEASWSRGGDIETSCHDPAYICRDEVARADIILVDGWNRGPCISWITHNARPGTVVFLHDFKFVQYLWIRALPCWESFDEMDSDGSCNPSPIAKWVLK